MLFKRIYKTGSALLSALFIMTLVAIAATAMGTRLQLDIHRTKLVILSDQLYLASQAATFWAFTTLTSPKAPQIPEEGLAYPEQFTTLYPGIKIKSRIYDLQSKLNINNIQMKSYKTVFEHLLKQVLKKTPAAKRKAIIKATDHWISPYHPDKGHDPFKSYYLKQTPPYFQGYQPMVSLSEFRLIKGVNAAIKRQLEPYITVLPDMTPININTAPKPILMSLGSGLTASQANEIIQKRQEKGIANQQELILLLNQFNIPIDQIALESQYFLCVTEVNANTLSMTYYTAIKRIENKNGKPAVGVIYERLNAL